MSKEVIRELEVLKKVNEVSIVINLKSNLSDEFRKGYVQALIDQSRVIKESIKCYKGLAELPF